MHKHLWFIAYFVVISFSFFCNNKSIEDGNEKKLERPKFMHVAVKPHIQVRDSAGLSGKPIEKIPYKTRVKILDDGASDSILGMNGKWVKVEWDNLQGWVFSPLLSKVDSRKSLIVRGNVLVDEKSYPAGPDVAYGTELLVKSECGQGTCERKISLEPLRGRYGSVKRIERGIIIGDPTTNTNQLYPDRWWLEEETGEIVLQGLMQTSSVCHHDPCSGGVQSSEVRYEIKLEKYESEKNLWHGKGSGSFYEAP